MRRRLVQLGQRLDTLSLRERLGILVAVLAVMVGLWEALLASPLAAREQTASRQLTALRQQLEQLDQAVETTAAGMNVGMAGKLERLSVLQQRLAETEESVRVLTSDLVDPGQMRFVLEDLMRRQQGLRLVSFANLDVEPLLEPQDGAAATDAGPNLYRHGMQLVMEGPYLQCLRYLRLIEDLPWQLYWGRLELEADSYPLNRISLELHTLSLEEEWLGV